MEKAQACGDAESERDSKVNEMEELKKENEAVGFAFEGLTR